MTESDARHLSEAARSVLEGRLAAAGGVLWPRAAALLARQALEEAIRSLWTGRYGGAEACRFRHQLLCARAVLGDELAMEAHHTWAALSQACHVHAYELSPVAAELGGWMGVVDSVVARAEDVARRQRLGPDRQPERL